MPRRIADLPDLPYDEENSLALTPSYWSSGYDNVSGPSAMQGLVNLAGSASTTGVINKQAEKLAQILQVARVRAKEAKAVVAQLEELGKGEGPEMNLAGGPGFGKGDDSDDSTNNGSFSGGSLPDTGALSGGLASAANETSAGKENATSNDDTKSETSFFPDGFDHRAYEIDEALKFVLRYTNKAVDDASALSHGIVVSANTTRDALRTTAQALALPGFRPQQADFLLPQPAPATHIPRPTNLAPSWLDFLFSTSPGSDPYKTWRDHPRKVAGTLVPGKALHNPFGSPPLRRPKPRGGIKAERHTKTDSTSDISGGLSKIL